MMTSIRLRMAMAACSWMMGMVLSSGCSSATNDFSWSADVHPLLRESCGSCHDPMGPITPYQGPGGFGALDPDVAFDAVRAYVTPGDPEKSPLYLKVVEKSPAMGQRMPPPPVPGLSPDQQEILRVWIEAGALSSD